MFGLTVMLYLFKKIGATINRGLKRVKIDLKYASRYSSWFNRLETPPLVLTTPTIIREIIWFIM